MGGISALVTLADDLAQVLPEVDASVAYERRGDGLGGFGDPEQIAYLVEALSEVDDRYGALDTEVRYPAGGKRVDLVLDTRDKLFPIETKLLRFNRANGNVEPAAYATIFSPLPGSIPSDAQKLTESGFGTTGGLLGIYYERGDEEVPVYDPDVLGEKVVDETAYWVDIELELERIDRFSGLRHPVHKEGAILAWAIH